MGWTMMAVARQDPWSGRTTTGFKGALTTGQGSDVYRHLWGHAGGVLATRTFGGAASNYELAQDVWQWITGKEGAKAEVLGSLAGQAVGAAMWLGRGNVVGRVGRLPGLLANELAICAHTVPRVAHAAQPSRSS